MAHLFPCNVRWCQTAGPGQREHILQQEGRIFMRKWKADLQGPVMIYRLTRPVNTIIEGLEKEKKNVIAGQAAIIQKLRRYMP
jgi:predicted transcriptional regulator